ncbi:ABC transporter permease [Macrococcus equipercicus]|uniref:Putative hemin transport system permease protein HrtB n=1 Tax=Macrococcus equipercicus TaxID=69967 RepID=A0A9Q9F2B5_9STAP|nr:ABC transporter permease [Macrococcus equipercicus]UTH14620.1 ABC transporter permease [Macrococcus equipercicus]
MKLALKELSYYKLKYLLITAILFLLAFLVLFVTSLAQGLGQDNVSAIDHMKAEQYIIDKDADHQLTQSALSDKDKQLLTDYHIDLLAMQLLPLTNNLFVAAMYSETMPERTIVEGRMPKQADEIAVDESLQEKLKLNDTLTVKNKEDNKKKIKYRVTGFIAKEMYAHTPAAIVTKAGFEQFNPDVTPNAGFVQANDKAELSKLKDDLSDSEIITADELKKGIPSFEAEQMPLQLMVVFLFVISAIVISAFFYVITIQKTNEYGILKAIGMKNRKIALVILAEIMLITFIGVAAAIILTVVISMFLPATMPFYLNHNLVVILAGLFFVVSLIGAMMSLIKVIKIDPQVALGGE